MTRFRRYDFGDPALPAAFVRPALTVGVFDGVHLGHAALLERLLAAARAAQVDPVVLTFWPHPRGVVGAGAPPLISTLDHRVALLRRRGVAGVVVLRFDREVASWPAEEFAERVLGRGLGASRVLVGADHRFGKERKGDVALLTRVGARLGFAVEAVPLVAEAGGARASSTAVRDAIRAGDLDQTARLLGRPLAVLGRVVAGDRRGRQLGFPTANLDLGEALRPPRGVYACRARTVEGDIDGPPWPAVTNVGRRPTFGPADQDLVEVHLLEGGQDLYGADLEVEFVARLRDEQKFAGLEALKAQIARDVEAARALLR